MLRLPLPQQLVRSAVVRTAQQYGYQRAATMQPSRQLAVRLLSLQAPAHNTDTERALARIVSLKKQLNNLNPSREQQVKLADIRQQLRQAVSPAQRRLLQEQEAFLKPDAATKASIITLNDQISRLIRSLKAQGVTPPSRRSSAAAEATTDSSGSMNDAPAWAQPQGQSAKDADLQRLRKYQVTAELEALNWKVHELTGEQSARRAALRAELAELGGPLQLSERVQVRQSANTTVTGC
jgi:hypothetical protein